MAAVKVIPVVNRMLTMVSSGVEERTALWLLPLSQDHESHDGDGQVIVQSTFTLLLFY